MGLQVDAYTIIKDLNNSEINKDKFTYLRFEVVFTPTYIQGS